VCDVWAGMPDPPHPRRRRLVGAAAVTLLLVGCSGGEKPPTRLLDGSPPPASPSALGAVDGAVMTIARTLPETDGRAVACGKRFGGGSGPPQPIVERIGVEGRSVTFSDGARIFACDTAAAAREGPADTCGGAAGKREGRLLTDPRLELANCTDADGDTVAFAWIEPGEKVGYVGVERDGWVEIYPARAGLPVRVATTEGIGDDDASLTLALTQYAADGREVRKEDVEAHVAG
jgi:hypothetical protein